MKTRHIALLLGLCALMLTPGCIRNDIPYPVVPLEILGIEGEGFKIGRASCRERV